MMKGNSILRPWWWVPTLYFAEGIPYFIVNTISVIMFKNMGMGNAELALYTGLLYLPWTIKPLWSPFVDILKSKRWWIIATQLVVSVSLAFLAAVLVIFSTSLGSNSGTHFSVFTLSLIIFWLTAFASATHDIAADGFYMLALDGTQQSFFVGIRSTFYRLSSVFGQGILVVIAGILQARLGSVPLAWSITMAASAALFAALTLYHTFSLPKVEEGKQGNEVTGRQGPQSQRTEKIGNEISEKVGVLSQKVSPPTAHKWEGPNEVGRDERSELSVTISPTSSDARKIIHEFGYTFKTFFAKRGIGAAMLFMLLFRLPEALLIKMLNPFLLDGVEQGGLGLATETVGIVYGTIGVIALTVGGILGGMAASKWGLRRVLWPMSLSLALPCAVFLGLSLAQPSSLWIINLCVALDQFGYGFGFTAYMLYLIQFADGPYKTSHYSLCTAFMALSMMLPGLVAGLLQESLGYVGFFALVICCCAVTIWVTAMAAKRI